MLPVFTSPLGSRKDTLLPLLTLYCLRASANEALLGKLVPFVCAPPLSKAAAPDAPFVFVRTRSAQDFGAAFGGGVSGATVSSASPSRAPSAPGASTLGGIASLKRGGGDLAAADGDEVEVFRGAAATFGTAGMMGTAVLVSLLACT